MGALVFVEFFVFFFRDNLVDKEVHAFPEGISPKVNVIEWLERELVYYDVKVQQVSHLAT